MRQLDRVSRELLARAWSAGAGPGDSPLTIDLDSTVCETYGLAKEGTRRHNYTGQRGYHPLLAGRLTRSARRLTLHLPGAGPGQTGSVEPWSDCALCHFPSDGGNRSSGHILIRQPVHGLLNSLRTYRQGSPDASGPSVSASSPLTEACQQTASGTI